MFIASGSNVLTWFEHEKLKLSDCRHCKGILYQETMKTTNLSLKKMEFLGKASRYTETFQDIKESYRSKGREVVNQEKLKKKKLISM